MHPPLDRSTAPAGIIGMPGCFAPDSVAGFERNHRLVSSECAFGQQEDHGTAQSSPAQAAWKLEFSPALAGAFSAFGIAEFSVAARHLRPECRPVNPAERLVLADAQPPFRSSPEYIEEGRLGDAPRDRRA